MKNSLKKVKMDRISELSDSIIYHIQSFLPLKDAARTCILSKSWNHVCNLYPILYLDYNLFKNTNDHNLTMDDFLGFVDNRLLENQSLRMLGISFSLAGTDIDKYSSGIDHLMELVTQATYVEELSVSVSLKYEMLDYSYRFKLPILATKGLGLLTLNGCCLMDCYSNHNINISSSLRHLSLSDVCFTQDAWDSLAYCCPLIETIEVKECYTLFKRFSLSKFSKSLKKATLGYFIGCERVILTGNNLTSFSHECLTKCEIDVAACTHIKQLSLEACPLYVRGKHDLFRNFSAVFPVIEEANISVGSVRTGFASKILKVVSHHHLRTLNFSMSKFKKAYINDCPNLTRLEFRTSHMKELHVDCPNLRHFYYYGSSVPTLLFNASTDIQYLKWVFGYLRLDYFWFVKLRKLVKQMSGYTFDLRLYVSQVTDSLTSKENQGEDETLTEESNINLELIMNDGHTENQACLLNWSLWSTYPSTLFVFGNAYDLLKELCDKLSKRYEEEDEGEGCNDKSLWKEDWWHHVKDFEVECPQLQIQDIKANLPTLVEFHKTTKCDFTFKFHWYSNHIKT